MTLTSEDGYLEILKMKTFWILSSVILCGIVEVSGKSGLDNLLRELKTLSNLKNVFLGMFGYV